MKLAAIVALALLVVVGAQQPFPCQDFTVPPPPKTIHYLHPAHVSIVLAMGDSITAAFAARGTLMESRDISWSAGVGTPTQLTMPYMINQYAAKAGTVLEGMSVRPNFHCLLSWYICLINVGVCVHLLRPRACCPTILRTCRTATITPPRIT